MHDIRLVGAVHDETEYLDLLSEQMDGLMLRDVVPYIDASTVIVVEGGKRRGVLHPTHPDYWLIYRQLGPAMQYAMKPTLHATDAMWDHFATERELLECVSKENAYMAAATKRLEFTKLPRTWDEMISLIRSSSLGVRLKKPLPTIWKKYAEDRVDNFRKRDALFAEQILGHANEGKRVFFVGGLLHVINLAATYDWRVCRLECDRAFSEQLYRFWYITYRITELLV